MRIPGQYQRSDIGENVMTPMIDVVFNLLIFFVCASALSVQELVLKTDLAAQGTVESSETKVRPAIEDPPEMVFVCLTVNEGGELVARLNDSDFDSMGELLTALRELSEIAPESPVVLDIDHDVESGDMIRVYDTCRRAKFESIQFAVDSSENSSK